MYVIFDNEHVYAVADTPEDAMRGVERHVKPERWKDEAWTARHGRWTRDGWLIRHVNKLV